MLIAFTGAQSSGKSTLLQECKKLEEFKDYTFIDEVTRRIKRTHGVEINNSAANYDYTQTLIIADHLNNLKLKNAVLDRCLFDSYVYTWYLYTEDKVSNSVYDFACSIYSEYYSKYDIIFYTDPNIPLVSDGERSDDVVFRNRIIQKFAAELKYVQKLIVLSGTVEERIKTIKESLKLKQVANDLL